MRHSDPSKWPIALILLIVALFGAGCGGKHYLAQYDFSDRTHGLDYIEPPAPKLLHGYYNLGASVDAMQSVMRAGGAVAKEVEARRASARLDSALRRVNVPEILAERTVARASRYLGTQPVATPRGADYVLEVDMRSMGIDARYNTAAYLYTNAEAVLIDRRTGREIWSVRVNGNQRLTPTVHGTEQVPSSIITAGTLAAVTVQDFQDALEQLVTYSSRLITDELRDKLRDVRDR